MAARKSAPRKATPARTVREAVQEVTANRRTVNDAMATASVEVLDDYTPAPGVGSTRDPNPIFLLIQKLISEKKSAARVVIDPDDRTRVVNAWQRYANMLDKTARAYDEASRNGKAVIVFKLTDKIVRTREN